MTTNMPFPEHRTAMLVPDLRDSAGRPMHLAPTLHHYSHTEEHNSAIPVQPTDLGYDPCIPTAIPDVAYQFIFRCSHTGAWRVFGCEGPNSPGFAADHAEESV